MALALATTGAARAQVIESLPVSDLDAWRVGAFERQDPAIPASLWRGSDGGAIAALMDRLPSAYRSATASALARAILLTPAERPDGDYAAAARARYAALARMGEADALVRMIMGSAEAKADPEIAAHAIEGAVAANGLSVACQRLGNLQFEQPRADLVQLRALCLAVDGRQEAALLALDAAQAAGNPWLNSVVRSMAGTSAHKRPSPQFGTSIEIVATVAGGLDPPSRAQLLRSSPMGLLTAARSDRLAPALRAEAAFQAFAANLMGRDEALQVLLAAVGQQDAPPVAASIAKARLAVSLPEQAIALREALEAPNSQYEFAAIARLLAPELATLPRDALPAGAATFARAALVNGEFQAARRFRESAVVAAPPRGRLTDSAPLPVSSLTLASIDLILAAQRRDETALAAAVSARIAAAGRAKGLAGRDLAGVAALDLEIGPEGRAFLSKAPPVDGKVVARDVLVALGEAAHAGRVGETGLLAASILEGGAERLNGPTLAAVVTNLRKVGLEHVAMAALVEAFLARETR